MKYSTQHLTTYRVLAFFGILLLSSAACEETRAQLAIIEPKPWPKDPITISFAPDLVEIGLYRNELQQHLNSQLSHPDWRIEILRAFQTWARYSDIRFAVVRDSERAFGIPGLAQGDPRFGDIRIGAFPQENVLGNAVPFNYESGTWAGDIFLDTNRQFTIQSNETGSGSNELYDLYSVLLHEVGNSLGLVDELLDFDSVMFFAYVGRRQDLSPSDVENIQALYGAPQADIFEPAAGNDSFDLASSIPLAGDFQKQLVTSVRGRVSSANDVDIYQFEGTSASENCWIKLRAQGQSLLCGRITAYDEELNEIATIAAEDPIFNTVGKEITNIGPGELVYVVVEWAGVPDFDFGDYELVLDFNETGGRELEGSDYLGEDDDDQDGQGLLEAGDAAIVDLLYDSAGLLDTETTANNSFARATELLTPVGMEDGSRFEIISTLATPVDVDTYRIRTSFKATGVLSALVIPLGTDTPDLTLLAYDETRTLLPVTRHFRTSGDVAVTIENVQPDSTVYLRIRGRAGNTLAGNYLFTVDVPTSLSSPARIHSARLTPTNAEQFGSFTTYKTQLFQFQLSMRSSDMANQACQLTIYNDQGRIELATSVRSGLTRKVFVWLQAGTHTIRFTARSRSGRPIRSSVVELGGTAVSDDEGPLLIDPSGNPISDPQSPNPQPPPPPRWQFPILAILELFIPPEFPW